MDFTESDKLYLFVFMLQTIITTAIVAFKMILKFKIIQRLIIIRLISNLNYLL